MRYAVGLHAHHPVDPEFFSGPFLTKLGRTAEAAGFDAVFFTEHPMPSDDWLKSGGHDALDPFVALAYVAASTTTLRLFTNLTVLPYRNPFLLAKSVATLDLASGGRTILGAGVGYLEAEYAALGVPFEERNDRFDESLELLRAAWTGRTVTVESPRLRAEGNTQWPAPVQDPLPIWLGGNAKITLRRVAAHAQGWMPLINPRALGARRRSRHLENLDDLRGYLDELAAECERIGRTEPIDIIYLTLAGGSPLSEAFDASAHLAGIAENAALGVNWNIVTIGGGSPAEVVEALDRYGETVINAS